MKTKEIDSKEIKGTNLKDIKGILSRDQMKQIKGGSGYFTCNGGFCQFFTDYQVEQCMGFLSPC